MDKTIILPELSKTIGELTGCSAADAENFVRELFILAAERLEADGEVFIPEIGSFKLTDSGVAFAPSPDLAAAINAPFAAFEAVELPADMDFDDAQEENSQEEDDQEEAPAVEIVEQDPEPEEITEDVTEEIIEPEPSEDVEQSEPSEESVEPEPKRRKYIPFVWIMACVASFAGGWYSGRIQSVPVIPEPEIPVVAEEIPEHSEHSEHSEASEISEISAAPEPEIIITDTIAPGRFLTTMAREHYGQMDYWVYIYEENASRLGHPDRLSAGTVVVVPNAEKYGLKPGDAVKISEASRLAREIYERFN